ncbi:transporter substrate-binding domain-containing protein [Phormidium sp. CCY1219]|jgi:polar amino acid transport system substrate-binding protein|uniref:transporter substrate-binding domain-containing protein n=1 Tax=Phormidium sp. CCY1219 TaxID=2886104 RepID=UPI002D1E9098|nr:transporter substrate-binding domain-containing protein [Phormidium sp. CCY1219]MEB3829474.1 transporter substrate-binding domain-containing protein [Phormidium sp. CCY1219]
MMTSEGKRIGIFLISFAFCLFSGVGETRAAELEAIAARGKLRVAVKNNLRPLGFTDSTGNLQGFEIDIARRLAEELLGSSEDVELLPVQNRDRLAVVISGEVDLAIARVTATPSRARVVYFSFPYYLDGATLITRDPTVREPSDLFGKAIAVLNASSTLPVMQFRIPQAKLLPVNSYQDALSLLETNTVSAFAADATVLTGWVQQYPEYRQIPVRFSAQPLAIVMPKGLQYQELHSRVNRAIARWQAEGWLQERAEYWGLPLLETPNTLPFPLSFQNQN